MPVCLLPSGDEDKAACDAVYEKLEKKNPGKNFIKYYPDEVHGWTAARGEVSRSSAERSEAERSDENEGRQMEGR